MNSHEKQRAVHDKLCHIVAKYMKRYDVVVINQSFCRGRVRGDHDVLGLILDYDNSVLEAVSYEIKGRVSDVGRDKALRQTRVKQRAMRELYRSAKLKTFYVTQNHVEEVSFAREKEEPR